MLEKSYAKLSDESNKMFVVVAGNIGSGKTTLTSKLSERLGWKAMYESVEDNPYLEDFYKDMSRWSFPLQVYFLTHRFDVHRKIEGASYSAVQDRSIYEDSHIFARGLFEQGLMSKREYENYHTLYKTMLPYLSAPSLLIGLRRSVPQLMDRIRQRNRGYEQSISSDYIARLNDYYDDWYAQYDLGKSLIIDTDDLDFLENESDFDRLITQISDTVDQKDMFFGQC